VKQQVTLVLRIQENRSFAYTRALRDLERGGRIESFFRKESRRRSLNSLEFVELVSFA
jgi:hypothetical protein